MGYEVPEIGRWYSRPDGNLFEVVAVDDNEGTIEMQHFDGTIDETDPDGWFAMRAEAAEPPEDWSGSVDINDEDIPGSKHPLFIDWKSHIEMLDEPESD
ncbi:MAG: DUF6763 family protein [Gammaproteobacteria bacterium]